MSSYLSVGLKASNNVIQEAAPEKLFPIDKIIIFRMHRNKEWEYVL